MPHFPPGKPLFGLASPVEKGGNYNEAQICLSLCANLINHFFIELGAKGHSGKRLGLSPCKQGRTMCSRQEINFTGNRTYLVGFSSIQPDTFIKNQVSDSILLHIMKIPANKGHPVLALQEGIQ
jgi:hypothetical protein